jgi:hypothetical protein
MPFIEPGPWPRRQLGGDRHRFLIAERWSDGPILGFLGMNPSDASDERPDPTWSRGRAFAQRWGFGGQLWGNPVPLRSPTPGLVIERLRDIVNGRDAGGLALMEQNLMQLAEVAATPRAWIIGWGDKGAEMNDVYRCHLKTVATLKLGGARALLAFGLTASGNPTHLLARGKSRIPDDATPRHFDPITRRLGDYADMRSLAR